MKPKTSWVLNFLAFGLLAIVVFLFLLGAVFFLVGVFYNVAFPQSCVGVIRVDGTITSTSEAPGLLGAGTTGADDIIALIEEAERRPDIKAVVFEINSPGGSAVAGQDIYDEIRLMEKPSVAYFNEIAASSGYEVGAGTDYIVSHPIALTGSIGARMTVQGLYDFFEKVGFNYTTVKSGRLKDMGDPSKPVSDEEVALLQAIVDEAFADFRKSVYEGRVGKPRFDNRSFESVLDARILSGRQAYELGLVDELGNRKTALRKAANMSGMSEQTPQVCELRVQKPLLEELLSSFAHALRISSEFQSPKPALYY